jgi:hypothetical protein
MVNTHLVLLQETILYNIVLWLRINRSSCYNKSGITITLSKALGASSYKLDDVVITTTIINKKLANGSEKL